MPEEKAEVECPKCGSGDTYLNEYPLGFITSLTNFVNYMGRLMPSTDHSYFPLVVKGSYTCRSCGHTWKV